MEELQDKVKKYMILGILATVFCLPLAGVVAVYYAGRANTFIALDNPAKAMMAAEKAKFWGLAAVVLGAAGYICALAAWLL